MKKQILQIVIVIASLIFFTDISSAVSDKHNFSSDYATTFIGSSTEICIYCHTPHSARVLVEGVRVALWNRSNNEETSFTMYTSPTFDADNGGPITKPTGPSLLCLSCHDGVTTLGSIGTVVVPGAGGGIINHSDAQITFNYGRMQDAPDFPAYANAIIGKDLSDDHPVSFVFDGDLIEADRLTRGASTTAKLQLPPAGSPLKLSNGRLECTTCHDPHDYGAPGDFKEPFLRMSNQGSAMCTECHLI